eukprot:CAMPEP_0206200520 /NCGR_PEP_ID=MMETSP0166-20121206/10930_1 /ASSEMBLY_ACC=CAM_ASM_000260 /TAXON_ID=95228 /ORGANISM="Vannella robusta, Strain DIVA3 518/3/11/1/6" /LENGTH=88 /DNA_ID=CAMNT_0053618877 /DNA_START=61 /DNA_END=324 /DNA_ORIENTATION=-
MSLGSSAVKYVGGEKEIVYLTTDSELIKSVEGVEDRDEVVLQFKKSIKVTKDASLSVPSVKEGKYAPVKLLGQTEVKKKMKKDKVDNW